MICPANPDDSLGGGGGGGGSHTPPSSFSPDCCRAVKLSNCQRTFTKMFCSVCGCSGARLENLVKRYTKKSKMYKKAV